jgi:uncharacterized coiled-coil protein SlyX
MTNQPSRMQVANQTIERLNMVVAAQDVENAILDAEVVELAEALLDRWPINVGQSIRASMRMQKMKDIIRMELPLHFDEDGMIAHVVRNFR